MLEDIILGLIQGVAEWLPVSSEGMLVLAQTHLFGQQSGLSILVEKALFLHTGTFLAALVYLRHDVKLLLRAALAPHKAPELLRRLLFFLAVSTAVSGVVGLILLELIAQVEADLLLSGRVITALVGVFLLITGFLQKAQKAQGRRELDALNWKDALLLGLVQGLAVLPGLSRSGMTVSTLLLRRFDEAQSLRLSFLMSLPMVFLGSIVLQVRHAGGIEIAWVGLLSACVFGLLMIHWLMAWAKKVQLGNFVIGFGILMIVAAVVA